MNKNISRGEALEQLSRFYSIPLSLIADKVSEEKIKWAMENIVPGESGSSQRHPYAARLMLLDWSGDLPVMYRYNDITGEVLPYRNLIMQMSCSFGHTHPVEECICGLQFTVDFNWIKNHGEPKYFKKEKRMVVVAIFELLGKVIVDNKYRVRSQGAKLTHLAHLEYSKKTDAAYDAEMEFMYSFMASYPRENVLNSLRPEYLCEAVEGSWSAYYPVNKQIV